MTCSRVKFTFFFFFFFIIIIIIIIIITIIIIIIIIITVMQCYRVSEGSVLGSWQFYLLQSCTNSVHGWCNSNFVKFNVNKTSVFFLSSNQLARFRVLIT